MGRFFNVAGPCDPRFHHMVPAAGRLPGVPRLVERGAYFVVHAPRQTGKTTTLRAISRALTRDGELAALHFSCEAGGPFSDDPVEAQQALLHNLRLRAELDLGPELRPPSPWPEAPAGGILHAALAAWARSCTRRLVLFFDEIDALRGRSLDVVLRQLRAAYPDRPDGSPWSVALCGLRDVRDYKAAAGGDAERMGTSSPFNIKDRSMRLGDFSAEEARGLLAQHTEETGQPFSEEALDRVYELSQGQPWLVNALAREVTEELGVEPPEPITAEHVDEAKERLVLDRATHLDSLVARLMEPRVRRLVEPLLAGAEVGGGQYDDDFTYVRDLGLVAPTPPLRVSNPVYREVIARVLASAAEHQVRAEPRSFVRDNGTLDVSRLLEEFAAFWHEHGETIAARMPYHEVAPQLVLMAFLQRIVNSGGYIDREYGVGRGRIDLLVRWPYPGPGGRREWQREAFELKVWRPGRPDPLAGGRAARVGETAGATGRPGRRDAGPAVRDEGALGAAAAALVGLASAVAVDLVAADLAGSRVDTCGGVSAVGEEAVGVEGVARPRRCRGHRRHTVGGRRSPRWTGRPRPALRRRTGPCRSRCAAGARTRPGAAAASGAAHRPPRPPGPPGRPGQPSPAGVRWGRHRPCRPRGLLRPSPAGFRSRGASAARPRRAPWRLRPSVARRAGRLPGLGPRPG